MNGNGKGPGPDRVPALPPIPPFEPHRQHWQRMPDGETFRVVQYGALDLKPTVIYVGMGVLMHLVSERMEQAAAPLMRGWAERWNAYRDAAESTERDYGTGVMKLDGKDQLNSGQRPPNG